MLISAYIPCFNNVATVRAAVQSVQKQTVSAAELFVIDDGSTDKSCQHLEAEGVRVVRHERTLGRGAVRARAVLEARHEYIMNCDATCALPAEFVARASNFFSDASVAAVFGRMWQENDTTVAARWRGRHLFHMNVDHVVNRRALFSTGGSIARKSAILEVGNFDAQLRFGEDADLGQRLLDRGYEVIFDPSLHVRSLAENSIAEVLERYWRWHAGGGGRMTLHAYRKQIAYSFKVMAHADVRARDFSSALVSLLAPHYQFCRSRWSRRKTR